MNQIRIRPAAEADIDEACAWYAERNSSLGDAFMQCLDEAFSQLRRNPHAWQVVYKDARRALVKKFPYSIIFRIRGERVMVLAVAHASRDPKRWQTRL